jgi:hypothetical protein
VRRLRLAGLALAWLVLASLFSAGAAGIVTGMEHSPGSAARPELTWAADEAATAALDASLADLAALESALEELGIQARGALAALAGQDLETVQAAIDEGTGLVTRIRFESAAIRSELALIPGVNGPAARLTTSDAVRARHGAMVEALDATEGLGDAWGRLTAGAPAAARMSQLLADHDRIMGEAILEGRVARYGPAIDRIDEAAVTLGQARQLRDLLANTVDVEVLDEWLNRNLAYENALRDLYAALRESGGRRTADVREALEAHEAARRQLPPDARGLVVIMAEIGRGGINGAVIGIEQARGRLASAIEQLAEPTAAP